MPAGRQPRSNRRDRTDTKENEMNDASNFDACIEACNRCAVACERCFGACLREDDVKAMAGCIALDADCAAMCQLAVAAMARGSRNAQAICALCADICDQCAKECAQHPMDHCQACAAACRDCAAACRAMSGSTAG
jgi:hypothetical protein